MTISLLDAHPIQLHAVVDAANAITDVRHGSQLFSLSGDKLFDELRTVPQAQVEFHDQAGHEVHVWETLAAGPTKWARDSSTSPARSVSGFRNQMDAELMVISVAPGTSVPQEGPPAPGTTQKKVVVKIRKQSGLPI
jgi:hypothetical protein